MIEQQDQTCLLSGDITLDTLPDILERLQALVRAGTDTIDFSAVRNVDSSALGLIFSCRRVAHSLGRTLKVRGLPASLQSLASLYGVAEHLGA